MVVTGDRYRRLLARMGPMIFTTTVQRLKHSVWATSPETESAAVRLMRESGKNQCLMPAP